MIKRQLDLVKSCQTVSEVETRLGRNNIEEVIAEAEKELKLIPLMESWKPWEPLQNNPPPGQVQKKIYYYFPPLIFYFFPFPYHLDIYFYFINPI